MSKITVRENLADIFCLEDIKPPIDSFLSGKYKRSFAFKTIKDRLPVILTQIIDTLSREKDNITQKYGAGAVEDIKQVIGGISKLKNELVTNKPLLLIEGSKYAFDNDASVWNNKIEQLQKAKKETQTWYNTIWLICECYMYRRVIQELEHTNYLKTYDPFLIQKKESYFQSLKSMNFVSEHIMKLINTSSNFNTEELQNNFITFLRLSLWGNRCDLSLSSGELISQEHNPLNLLESLNNKLLIDDSRKVWNLLDICCLDKMDNIIDIVLDNAAYELFTDLCLAAYLITFKFAKKIRFYVKQYPWFISDVTTNDFEWLIESMVKAENSDIHTFGSYCEKCYKNNIWTIEKESFWTEPFDYSEMKNENPTLYNKLAEAKLVIFKGDLNYRKLLGDINWKYTTEFEDALRGFKPTNLVSLRTLKADLCVGLQSEKIKSLDENEPDWMITGKYGLIQSYIH
ncbi:damage-control phosphatase ARMT1-like [Phymastichus coffea]|uniref:damage-control phosphatase ARMT1-like n=1 Tax=Phymastichus coffea TaxID=108790 RepID=UPI00273B9E5C|nr:damage-control phosphatase ARMT1-like [Phymastichus coffea]